MENLFLRPERPFLVLFEVNGVRDYAWCDDLDDVMEMINDNKKSFPEFRLEEVIEIASYRTVEI